MGILKRLEIPNRLLLWFTYMKPHFQYLMSILEVQQLQTQQKFKLLWKRSLKEWLFLPKTTPDQFLESLVGRIVEIAAFQRDKTEYLIEKRYQGCNQYDYLFNKVIKNRIQGIKNIPSNLRELFLLPLKICLTHSERMSFQHIIEKHRCNPLKKLREVIRQKFKLNRRNKVELMVNQLIQEAGEFISKKPKQDKKNK